MTTGVMTTGFGIVWSGERTPNGVRTAVCLMCETRFAPMHAIVVARSTNGEWLGLVCPDCLDAGERRRLVAKSIAFREETR